MKLEPCPFCGQPGSYTATRRYVTCANGDCAGYTIVAPLDEWNVRAPIASPPAPAPSKEWVMVPVDPTEEMHAAANREWDGRMSARSAGVWQAMLAARPAAEQNAAPQEVWDYAIGETAYIATGQEELREGIVVHRFLLDGFTHGSYVVELQTPMDPIWEVREAHTMSRKPGGGIDLYKVRQRDPKAGLTNPTIEDSATVRPVSQPPALPALLQRLEEMEGPKRGDYVDRLSGYAIALEGYIAALRNLALPALREAVRQNGELTSERDAIRELLSIHNLGGMTDYTVGPMIRALTAEALVKDLADANNKMTERAAMATDRERELAEAREDAERWRKRARNQRTELRRLNKYLGPYWAGFKRGIDMEGAVKLRCIMNDAFGHAAVHAAEVAALSGGAGEKP